MSIERHGEASRGAGTRLAVTDLPVEASVDEVREALAGAGHAVLQASPGAGKTTIVPVRLMDERWLGGRRILMLEPRRVAARAAAARMAHLLGEPVGATVGYRTRDEQRVGAATRVEVVTDGILTRRLQHDPGLAGVGLVVFDEIHERNLQTDVALALALDVRASLRPDLRMLAMSATVDTEGVAAVLGAGSRSGAPAPVVASPGRAHPVEIRWSASSQRQTIDPAVAVAAVVVGALAEDHGDVLVFLPGAADIRRAQARLEGAVPHDVDVLPLFGALPPRDQDRALVDSPPGRRRVVLATDIAETSLTVVGVRVVVDAGLVRSPRYDPNRGLTELHTGAASRSSADQRAGRAGREGPGVAYRLWSEDQHLRRPRFPAAEIASVDLAGLALELAVWGAAPGDLTFLEPPPQAALDEGRALLVMLGALDAGGRPTAEGRRMSDLPLHPRLARMVTGAEPLGRGRVACALAALLEDRDILRGRPDDVGADVASRVRLITDPQSRHQLADPAALSSARRRAAQIGHRVGVKAGRVDLDDCGRVLALAYPDRLAQGRPSGSRGRFRLRGGRGAWLDPSDPLAGEAFLVVGQLDAGHRDSRIRLAAALDLVDLETAAAARMTVVTELAWDAVRDDLRATQTRHLDHLVLGATERRPEPGPAAAAALLQHVRATRLDVLSWTETAQALRQRVRFLRRTFAEPWPDLSDPALLASLDEWLSPLLATVSDRAGLESLDLVRALRARLGPSLVARLDTLAPRTVAVGDHRRLRVDYRGDAPSAAAKVQDLYGVTRHPTIAGGRVPLVLHLLSPAGRPIQVTSDLPGFWAGSYADVRKEMAGRYPKHDWPADPADSQTGPATDRRRGR